MAAQFNDDLQLLNIWELFDLIQKAKTSKQPAVVARGKAAFKEFRRRYQRHVNRFVRSARSRIVCGVVTEEVVEGVFATVWEQTDFSRLEPIGDEKAERHLICLLFGSPICQNLIARLNDMELLLCARRRDEGEYGKGVSDRAFAEFVRLHVKRLRWQCTQFAWGILSEMEVEELVQDTFVNAWQGADTYTDDGISDRKRLHGRTDGWLNKTAYRLFLDRVNGCKDVEMVWCDDEEALDREGWSGWPSSTGKAESDPLSDKVLAALEACPDESVRQALSEVLYGDSGSSAQSSTAGEAESQSPYDRLLEALEDRAVEFTKEALLKLTDVERLVLQTDEQDFPDDEARLAAFRTLQARRGINDNARRQVLCRAKKRIRKYVQTRLVEFLRSLGLEVPPDAG